MSKKQPRVPGMRDVKPNREQRRHPERLEPQDAPLARDETPDSPADDVENVTNGRDAKKTNVANQYR